MKLGKVPGHILQRLFDTIQTKDPQIILGPRLGEDVALLDTGNWVLAAKTDPITFATDLIGWYAVQINANDIACSAAQPRWFLATLMFPPSVKESEIESIFQQILEACSSLDIELVGGHTEITNTVSQPVVVGFMLGKAESGKYITTSGAKSGDAVILTKGVSIEGSALLARELRGELISKGVDKKVLDRASDFLFDPGISVVKDAKTAYANFDVNSLHDPTEGGVSTGLYETAKSSGLNIEVFENTIPILPECSTICKALGIDPLGLLGSGSLLITLPKHQANDLISCLATAGIFSREIGLVKTGSGKVLWKRRSVVEPFPSFDRDEFARLLDERS
jgi:hydrogenase maturation factor